MKSVVYLLFFIYTTSLISRSISSLSIDPFLGISPQDLKYYKASGDVIKCKDGSEKFTKAQLNDDFCDCPDGSDEPGTSACPGGKFYCQNSGHVPILIFSSRVNDGICDCCDGSDEYSSDVKCLNTCWEAGKMARDKLKKKIATYQEGVTLRKREVEQAKVSIAKDEAELSKLKSEEKVLKGLVQQLKERKDLIEKAEEEQRLQREKEKAKTEDAEIEDKGKANERVDGVEEHLTDHAHDKIGISEDTPFDQDVEEDYGDTEAEVEPVDNYKSEGHSPDMEEKHDVEDEDVSQVTHETDSAVSKVSSDHYEKKEDDEIESNEALSKEELGRLVASRWTGENTGAQDHATKHHDHEDHQETAKDEHHDDDHDGYASDSDDDNQKYDDNENEDPLEEDFEDDHDDTSSYTPSSYDESDFSDIRTSSGSSWLEKIQLTVRNIIDSVNVFKAPVNISDADHVRKEYDNSSSKLTKIQSRISSLSNKLKHDFGPNKEFYSFYDHCFETKQNKLPFSIFYSYCSSNLLQLFLLHQFAMIIKYSFIFDNSKFRYVYKVCPFKQASQTEGYSTTRLGNWDKFEDSYRTMLFSNGEKCWNGPDRSLKVKLRCGLANEVADLDEPSRCEYVALLATPTLCLEEKLKELQEKLELMNKEQPQNHDEL